MEKKKEFPAPLLASKPDTHATLAVLVRPVEHFAMTIVGQIAGNVLYHVGIYDVDKNCVYHVNDPVGNSSGNATQQIISFVKATVEDFRGKVSAMYYYDHQLSLSDQKKAIQRAESYLNKPIKYDGLVNNCQTVVLNLLYPEPEPQQIQLVQKIIYGAFDFWVNNLPVNKNDLEPADPKKVDEIILSFQKTAVESIKAGAKVGTAVVVCSAILGPLGIPAGSIAGGLWAWATHDDFASICSTAAQAAKKLNFKEKVLLLRKLQAVAVMLGCSSLSVFVAANRALFENELQAIPK